MILIPVIDLLKGQAVHAHQGQRSGYRPLNTPLCQSGDAVSLAKCFVEQWGFTRLYIADLDAILGQGHNRALLGTIRAEFPQLEIWLDGGFSDPGALPLDEQDERLRCVVGSESWHSSAPLPPGSILSVDSDHSGPRDPSGICTDNARIPQDLILMNLERVGSQAGPDLELLREWRRRSPTARLFAAGGVRHRQDINTLEDAGAAGVLLASALHSGHLTHADLQT